MRVLVTGQCNALFVDRTIASYTSQPDPYNQDQRAVVSRTCYLNCVAVTMPPSLFEDSDVDGVCRMCNWRIVLAAAPPLAMHLTSWLLSRSLPQATWCMHHADHA